MFNGPEATEQQRSANINRSNIHTNLPSKEGFWANVVFLIVVAWKSVTREQAVCIFSLRILSIKDQHLLDDKVQM